MKKKRNICDKDDEDKIEKRQEKICLVLINKTKR